ncbi:hypothetical protein Tco_0737992 [Tanacetum coccineum]
MSLAVDTINYELELCVEVTINAGVIEYYERKCELSTDATEGLGEELEFRVGLIGGLSLVKGETLWSVSFSRVEEYMEFELGELLNLRGWRKIGEVVRTGEVSCEGGSVGRGQVERTGQGSEKRDDTLFHIASQTRSGD